MHPYIYVCIDVKKTKMTPFIHDIRVAEWRSLACPQVPKRVAKHCPGPFQSLASHCAYALRCQERGATPTKSSP